MPPTPSKKPPRLVIYGVFERIEFSEDRKLIKVTDFKTGEISAYMKIKPRKDPNEKI